jgi:hypothetical protein
MRAKTSPGACNAAVTVRTDHDAETVTARAVRSALPEWATTFGKRDFPLKLAYVATASLDGL